MLQKLSPNKCSNIISLTIKTIATVSSRKIWMSLFHTFFLNALNFPSYITWLFSAAVYFWYRTQNIWLLWKVYMYVNNMKSPHILMSWFVSINLHYEIAPPSKSTQNIPLTMRVRKTYLEIIWLFECMSSLNIGIC